MSLILEKYDLFLFKYKSLFSLSYRIKNSMDKIEKQFGKEKLEGTGRKYNVNAIKKLVKT